MSAGGICGKKAMARPRQKENWGGEEEDPPETASANVAGRPPCYESDGAVRDETAQGHARRYTALHSLLLLLLFVFCLIVWFVLFAPPCRCQRSYAVVPPRGGDEDAETASRLQRTTL